MVVLGKFHLTMKGANIICNVFTSFTTIYGLYQYVNDSTNYRRAWVKRSMTKEDKRALTPLFMNMLIRMVYFHWIYQQDYPTLIIR